MSTYQIKLAQFEGPFDLLLFFIERDELDIYNIPITKIINDFLGFIRSQESLNIELSSEFILFYFNPDAHQGKDAAAPKGSRCAG